jgi:folate-binding protein YgfZ
MPNNPNVVDQYRLAAPLGGCVHRTDRALIEVTGADRAAWLNNLVTNIVKPLQPGEGNYAFATNVKGRVVFDMNMLVLAERIWLDVDARWLPAARAHLEKYVITEDVKLADISAAIGRVAVIGARAPEVVGQLGLGSLIPMAPLQHVGCEIAGAPGRMVRNDFMGLPTAEFILMGDGNRVAIETIGRIAGERGMVRLDPATVEVLRIEAGIPRSVDDIDEDVVPPETDQTEKGISYHKGCYLGQEVIERMRSHGILARRLVGVRIEGNALPPRDAAVRVAQETVGRVTSSCWSEALQSILALGYVKTAHAKPGTAVVVDCSQGNQAGNVVSLPVSRGTT